ncbi:YceI family protein [Puniceicoccaceae bacterium K14]|nr:YceI family protein [Puniceicoccaceae bacterium K14]
MKITSILLLALISLTRTVLAADYELTEHNIKWTGSMPSQTHYGLLTPSTFEIDIDDSGKVEKLHVVLDMNSLNVTDLKEGKMRNKLTKHLLSDDFLNAKGYPTSEFELSSHDSGKLVGTITIRGIEKDIALPVEVTGDASNGWILEGSFDFDRQDFGVSYQNSGFLGAAKDKLIRDLVTMDIRLVVEPKS